MVKVQGFTLIELVTVIIIMGAIAAAIVPNFVSIDRDTHKAAVKTTAAAYRQAIKLISSKHTFDLKPGYVDMLGESSIPPDPDYFSFDNNGVVNDWPVGESALLTDNIPTLTGCLHLFNNGMHSNPLATSDTSGNYTVFTQGSNCVYYYLGDDPNATAANPKGFVYNILTGSVSTFGVD